jgi:aryl-alcohol dehydrogenase-like predicted oxidoreductase
MLGSTRIGQGGMGVGGGFTRDDSRDEHFVECLRRGIAQGLTFLDTAEAYGAGHSEELIGQAVAGQRAAVCLASKVSPEHLAHDDVLGAAERSLRRLGTDYLDLYQVHWPNPAVPIAGTMRALERLVGEGLVRHLGVSNFSVPEAEAAAEALRHVPLAAVQAELNLFDRTVEQDLLPWCAARGITFIAYSPLDGGRLARAPEPALREIATRRGVTPAQVALAWVVAHPGVIAIPTVTRRADVDENAGALGLVLAPAERAALDGRFAGGCLHLSPTRIRVDASGLDRFRPGPEELAQGLRAGVPLKPIRVRRLAGAGPHDYELVEGKLRYWAWVTARPDCAPIPALLREG